MTKNNDLEKQILDCIKAWKYTFTPTHHLKSILGLSKSNKDSQRLSRALKSLQKKNLIIRAYGRKLGTRKNLYKLVGKEEKITEKGYHWPK